MDLGFDHQEWGQKHGGLDSSTGLDWHGLRARLIAGRAARRQIDGAAREAASTPAGGSFAGQAARVLKAQGKSFIPVNPTSLTVRKGGLDNVAPVVGETRTGDRG